VRAALSESGFTPFGDYINVWYHKGLCIDLHESMWGEERLPYRKYIRPQNEGAFEKSGCVEGYYIPAPRSLARHTAFHALKHACERAVWVLDIMMLLERGFFGDCENSGRLSPVESYMIEYLRENGLAPDGTGKGMAQRRRTLKGIVLQRLLDAPAGGAGEIVLALSCPSWRRTIAYLWRSLFPGTEVLRQMYGRRNAAVLYMVRTGKLIGLAVRTLR
jgi:hypothetical protein